MQFVPLVTADRQTLRTALGGQTVDLTVWYQPLSRAWYLTLVRDAAALAVGRQLAPWIRVLRVDPRLLDGDLIVISQVGQESSPLGEDAWTDSHGLFYFTQFELDLMGVR